MLLSRVFALPARNTTVVILLSLSAMSYCAGKASADNSASVKAFAFYRKGKAEALAMEDDLAIQDYCLSLKYDPHCIATYLERGDSYSHVNKHKQAEADYLKALDLCTTSPNPADTMLATDTMRRLEPYYERIGQLPKALALWEKVVTKTHQGRDFLAKGRCEVTAKSYYKAEKDLLKALSDDKAFFEASLALGNLYVLEKKYTQALAIYSATIEKVKKTKGGFYTQTRYKIFAERSKCYAALKEPKLALDDKKTFERFRDEWYEFVPFRTK